MSRLLRWTLVRAKGLRPKPAYLPSSPLALWLSELPRPSGNTNGSHLPGCREDSTVLKQEASRTSRWCHTALTVGKKQGEGTLSRQLGQHPTMPATVLGIPERPTVYSHSANFDSKREKSNQGLTRL